MGASTSEWTFSFGCANKLGRGINCDALNAAINDWLAHQDRGD